MMLSKDFYRTNPRQINLYPLTRHTGGFLYEFIQDEPDIRS